MSDSAPSNEAGDEISVTVQAWSLPESVVVGERFTIKVGAKCADGRELAGGTIEVCDHAGVALASAKLHAKPWPETSALYWTEVILSAPAMEGPFSWSARFRLSASDMPCEATLCEIHFTAVAPPEHELKVKVLDKANAIPIADAVVRWGAIRASTDARGEAVLNVPKGANDLIVWMAGYDAPVRPLAIDADIVMVIEIVSVPEENPDDAWKM